MQAQWPATPKEWWKAAERDITDTTAQIGGNMQANSVDHHEFINLPGQNKKICLKCLSICEAVHHEQGVCRPCIYNNHQLAVATTQSRDPDILICKKCAKWGSSHRDKRWLGQQCSTANKNKDSAWRKVNRGLHPSGAGRYLITAVIALAKIMPAKAVTGEYCANNGVYNINGEKVFVILCITLIWGTILIFSFYRTIRLQEIFCSRAPLGLLPSFIIMPARGSWQEKVRNLERRLHYNKYGRYAGTGSGAALATAAASSTRSGWTSEQDFDQPGAWHRGTYYTSSQGTNGIGSNSPGSMRMNIKVGIKHANSQNQIKQSSIN